jgi:valyl-tRNA synthetase
MSTEIPKAYEAKNVEEKWYKHWLDKGYFTADPKSAKPGYCIVIPPPNVTGMLHMGHVLGDTIQDILCRRKRMQGYEVLWLPGMDHAGIGTQTVVEKSLRKQKVIRHRDDLGREKFIEKIWEWKDKHGGIILQQLKKLGCSLDWSREVFTMDGLDARDPNPRVDYSHLVLKVFVDLYKKGLIYRGKRMISWCPVSRTALSNEEVEMREVDGHLWHLKYPLLGADDQPHPDQFVVVATTRPETMLGDEAVAVNPNDERYKQLVGKKILLPLRNKAIPVIADQFVDPKFGTGCVKVTPAHDPNDYQMALRHKLPLTVVIGPDGAMTEEAREPFAGLDRFEARRAVVKELEEDGLLLKTEPYKHSIGYSEREGVPIEPMLSEQWFLRHPQSQRAIEAVERNEIQFRPEHWKKMYMHWMNNIQDWCISRQLWWGHRIPVWYDPLAWFAFVCPDPLEFDAETIKDFELDNHIKVQIERPEDPPPDHSQWKWARTGDGQFWHQDTDVLDTWFSSWLWPFATMGWPEKTDTMKKFYPTTDLVTGFDIIFLWVARMIMAGYEFTWEKPYTNVYYTGLVRDAIGRKMSKSLGNSPDPLVLIDKYGADGLRFGLMLIAPQGLDILFDEKRMEIGRNFCNKLWNACRLRQMQEGSSGFRVQGSESGSRLSTLDSQLLSSDDKYILLQLDSTIQEVNRALDAYEFNAAAQALYQFFWSRYCDWYLEASKSVLWGTDAVRKSNTLAIMDIVLSNLLRMLHPFMPFITEELWNGMGYSQGTIMFAANPSPFSESERKGLGEDTLMWVEDKYALISIGRNLRSEYQVAPGKKVKFIIKPNDARIADRLRQDRETITLLLSASEIEVSGDFAAKQGTPTGVGTLGSIYMPLEGAVDLGAEKTRLTKELEKARKDFEFAEAKLNNPSFRDRAPKDVVKSQETKRAEAQEKINQLQAALKALG